MLPRPRGEGVSGRERVSTCPGGWEGSGAASGRSAGLHASGSSRVKHSPGTGCGGKPPGTRCLGSSCTEGRREGGKVGKGPHW